MNVSSVSNSSGFRTEIAPISAPRREAITAPVATAIIEPSIYAQRLERALRIEPGRIAMPRLIEVNPNPAPRAPQKASWFKKATFLAACICGAAVLPSFSLFMFIGPLGFIAPAALTVACIALFALSGKPTPDMEMEMERTRQDLRLWDSRV